MKVRKEWLVLLAFIVWFAFGFHFSKESNINPFSDYWDYAQQARELTRGHGFQSLFTYPILLPFTHENQFYNLWRPPLYPFITSLFFRIHNLVSLVNLTGIFFLFTVFLIMLFAERIFDSKISWVVGLAYIFSWSVIQSATTGLSEPLFALLVTLFFYQYYRLVKQKTQKVTDYILLGVLFGFCWLTRNETVFFLIPVIYLLWLEKPKMKQGLPIFVMVIILMMSPWWIRNYRITGNPFFNMSSDLVMMFTPTYPGWSRFRMIDSPANPLLFLFTHFLEIGLKFIKLFIHNLWNLISLHILLVPLFLCSFLKIETIHKEKLKNLVFLCLGFLIIGLFFLESDSRFFLCLLPMMILFSISLICTLISDKRQIWIIGLIFVIFIIQAGMGLMNSKAMKADNTFSEMVNYISKNTPTNYVILTDSPDKLAWYTDRHTIWLPDIKDIKTIQEKYSRIDGILLTSAIQKLTTDPIVEEWKKVYTHHEPIDGFQLIQTFPDGSLYYQRK